MGSSNNQQLACRAIDEAGAEAGYKVIKVNQQHEGVESGHVWGVALEAQLPMGLWVVAHDSTVSALLLYRGKMT